MELSFAP
jgi:hypothetical protein